MRLVPLALAACVLSLPGAEPTPLSDGTTYPLFRRALPVNSKQQPPEDLIIATNPDASVENTIPDEKVAEQAGTHWLMLIDEGKYGQCYHFVAAFVQDTFKEMRWTDLILKQRKALGAVSEREMTFVSHRTSIKGGPAGRYMILHYFTRFAEGPRLEMVTLYQDNANNWRIAGYGIADTKS